MRVERHDAAMSNWYLKLTGKFAAALGRLDRYSGEHLRFLSSGYDCPRCSKTLMTWYGVSNVESLSAEGERVPVMSIRRRGRTFRCPNCHHQWQFRTV